MITISKGQLLQILNDIPNLIWKDTAFQSISEIMYNRIKANSITTRY